MLRGLTKPSHFYHGDYVQFFRHHRHNSVSEQKDQMTSPGTFMKFHEDIVTDLKNWIASNLDEKIVIADISERSGYSRWYLQRLFRKITGVTLASYVRQQRLTKAAHELLTTDHTIAHIAMQNGFADQQSFHRVFTRHYKQPPSQWRKNQPKPSSL